MVQSIILRPRSLLAVLALIGAFQPPQVEAARGNCKDMNFKAGEIITTSPTEDRTYCGRTVGRFLAIRDNELFHLHCQADAPNPVEAKVLILNLNNGVTRSQTFDSQQLCATESSGSGGPATGANAYNIAMKLSNAFVPFDALTCNAQHYIEYLAYGKTLNRGIYAPKPTCPVFKRFSQDTKTRGASFRLEGQDGMAYNWPSSGMRLTLVTPAPTPSRAVSVWEPYENANVSRASSLHTTNRKGGGGGHGSSSGHGGSSGGSSAGRGGGGGGSSETSGGNSGATAAIIGGAAANGGANNNKKRKHDTSAAGRIKPWFSLSGW